MATSRQAVGDEFLEPTSARRRFATSGFVQCPGCHQPIPLARPDEMPFEIARGLSSERMQVVTVTIGRVEVHRCTLCADGEWR